MPQIDSGPERGGTSREGLGPSSEAGTRPRGRQALEQGENLPERVPSIEQGGGFVVRCLPLERDGGSPKACRGRLFVGLLRLFGPWAFLFLGPRPRGV
jgi:hypothetical protein